MTQRMGHTYFLFAHLCLLTEISENEYRIKPKKLPKNIPQKLGIC